MVFFHVVNWLGLGCGVGVGNNAHPGVDLNAVGNVIIPVTVSDPALFGALLADFRVGLFLLNKSWIEPLKDLLTTLLVRAVSLDAKYRLQQHLWQRTNILQKVL